MCNSLISILHGKKDREMRIAVASMMKFVRQSHKHNFLRVAIESDPVQRDHTRDH